MTNAESLRFSMVPASVFGGHQWSMADSAISELISHFCWWRLPALIWDLLFHSSVPLPCRFNLPSAPAGFATCPVGLAGLTPTSETVSLCSWPAHGSHHTQAWLVPWAPGLLDGNQKQPCAFPTQPVQNSLLPVEIIFPLLKTWAGFTVYS